MSKPVVIMLTRESLFGDPEKLYFIGKAGIPGFREPVLTDDKDVATVYKSSRSALRDVGWLNRNYSYHVISYKVSVVKL
jgi:hypothetical protein